MQEQTVLLVGGPDSGKTNYLGRLWLAIRDGVGKIEADRVPNDLEYLNQIAGFLLQGQFAPRLSGDVTRNKVVIPVKISNEEDTLRSTLIVPDVAGEEWMSIYRKRGWSDEWEKDFSSVTGCLVFVRAESDAIIPAIDWMTWASLLPNVPQENPEVPTQVVLVDWLQCLRSVFVEKMAGYRPRIGVIVAAYDLLPNDQKELGPEEYLRSNFPLFWQYITVVEDLFDIRVFGTSIVDGDFDEDPDFRDRFLDSPPKDAGYVKYASKEGLQTSKDIGLPILWAMGSVSDI
jgi:hypothetical protein